MEQVKYSDPRLLDNENQLHVELMGLAVNMLPWSGNASPSRMIMLGSQISQNLVTAALTRNRYFTGVEFEYAKYTFAIRAAADFEIMGIIPKYQVGVSRRSVKENPSTIYIVKNLKTGEYDYLDLVKYCSHHNNFGWRYQINKDLVSRLYVGGAIRKGEILADSPAVSPEGIYRYSRLTNVAAISDWRCTEDGFLASNEWLEENRTTGFLSLDIIPPKDHYWLNLYGTEDTYKPFPGPGDAIREDGLVAALRKHSKILGAIDLTPRGLMEVDYHFDKKYYLEAGAHNPRVIDLDVFDGTRDGKIMNPIPTEEGTDYQDELDRYWERNREYQAKLLNCYSDLVDMNRGRDPRISKGLSSLLRTAKMTLLPPYDTKRIDVKRKWNPPRKVEFNRRGTILNNHHVKIRIMYDIIPDIGFKFSGLYGNKGVICHKRPRKEMYTDKWGHVADLVFDAQPPVNRMIPATPFEIGWNAHCRDQEERMREYVEEHGYDREWLWDYYLNFVRLAAPLHYDRICHYSPKEQDDEIKPIVDGSMMYLYLPPNTPTIGVEMMSNLDANYQLRKSTLDFVSTDGTPTDTVENILVGQMGVIMLEKTGHDYSAVDMPNRQIHGVPAKLTSQDKYSSPIRSQVIRIYGESEGRAYAALVGADYLADQIDRANNPRAQEMMAYMLMSSPKPTQLDSVIDRKQVPIGTGLHLSYMENTMYVAGARFKYRDIDGESLETE